MKQENNDVFNPDLIPMNSISRIERWHICQQIGVIYYDSQLTSDKLVELYGELKNRGIIIN